MNRAFKNNANEPAHDNLPRIRRVYLCDPVYEARLEESIWVSRTDRIEYLCEVINENTSIADLCLTIHDNKGNPRFDQNDALLKLGNMIYDDLDNRIYRKANEK